VLHMGGGNREHVNTGERQVNRSPRWLVHVLVSPDKGGEKAAGCQVCSRAESITRTMKLIHLLQLAHVIA
jgi:hypothetical protein